MNEEEITIAHLNKTPVVITHSDHTLEGYIVNPNPLMVRVTHPVDNVYFRKVVTPHTMKVK